MTTTKQYYWVFYNQEEIGMDAIKRVRRLIKEQQFFKQSPEDKLKLLKELSNDLSIIYRVNDISDIIIIPGLLSYGSYYSNNRIIQLNKPSLVTFLHEFKHHLNHEQQQNNSFDKEEDTARGFSQSLYFLATPKLFMDAYNRGLIVRF